MTTSIAERIPCLVVPLTRLVERDAHRVTTMVACLAAIDPVSGLSRLSLMPLPHFPSHRGREEDVALLMRFTITGQRTSHRMVVVHSFSCWGGRPTASGSLRTGRRPGRPDGSDCRGRGRIPGRSLRWRSASGHRAPWGHVPWGE